MSFASPSCSSFVFSLCASLAPASLSSSKPSAFHLLHPEEDDRRSVLAQLAMAAPPEANKNYRCYSSSSTGHTGYELQYVYCSYWLCTTVLLLLLPALLLYTHLLLLYIIPCTYCCYTYCYLRCSLCCGGGVASRDQQQQLQVLFLPAWYYVVVCTANATAVRTCTGLL